MMNPLQAFPALTAEWMRMAEAVDRGMDANLAELVKLRTSQINGCANCINLHAIEARKIGESEQRLHLLAAWHDKKCKR